jgi:hypothetical protein
VKRWLYGVKQYEAAKRAFPDQVHLLLLQDLQTEPEQTIGDVLQFLGIESSPAILSLLLSYHERPRSLQTPYNIDMTEAGKEAPPKSTPDMGYQRWQANLPLQVMSRNWTETFSETDYPQLHEQMRDTLIQYGFIR